MKEDNKVQEVKTMEIKGKVREESNKIFYGNGSEVVAVGAFDYNDFLKQEKKMQAMLDALEVGDSIETSGGLFGVVIDVSGDILIVEFGGDRHCRIPMRKTAVVSIEKANSTEE